MIQKNQGGFTLLEILIAITILATIMAFTAQSVIRSSRDKIRLQGEIDRDSKLTNALRLIERDINMAFHHRHTISEIEKDIKKASAQPQPNNPSAPPPSPPPGTNPTTPQPFDFEPREYPQQTKFMGTDTSLNFTSLSHVRTIENSPESDQQEVGYYLESCNDDDGNSTQCLWRRSTAYIDDDITRGGGASLLLTGVKTLKLRYYGPGKLDWVSAWRTDEGGDAATKDKFPLAVEITLVIEEKQKEASLSTVIPILFPNNQEEKPQNSAQPQQPPPPGTGR